MRIVGWVGLGYAVFVAVGMVPVNSRFQPPAAEQNGVELVVISTAVHADLVMPIESSAINWREHFPAACFAAPTDDATHVAIGWGDEGFFLHTRTWADLRLAVAMHALFWPSRTCLHVRMTRREWLSEDARTVRISPAQYERLVEYVLASFQRDEQDRLRQIPGAAYGWNDAFFEAHGSYHAANTCNSWIGRALSDCGVRTGLWTPLPKTVFWYLPAGVEAP
jgi:uncharacterized protein (TIGR02117 family)